MQSQLHIYDDGEVVNMPDFYESNLLNDPSLYKAGKELKDAVNIAMLLGKPLLVTGEPGTGKTQLAHSVAYKFGMDSPLIFNTRSTSTATDLFYIYDAIKHLQYAQNQHNEVLSNDEIEQKFIHYQALGKAIQSGKRQVVLIDEVDKAPRDLSNDILNVLEDMEFTVPEVHKSYKTEKAKRPVIIFTSNSEKNLPDAFLRRCIYIHLKFPSEDNLLEIVSSKIENHFYSKQELQDYVIPHFMVIRDTLKKKKPSTSEFLHWVTVLENIRFSARNLTVFKNLSNDEKQKLYMTYCVLAKNEEDVNIIREFIEI